MASEAKRGFIRIISNYGRLLVTFVLGLMVVRLQLLGLGREALALLLLMGSTVGLAAMLQSIIGFSMIRELGAAYHSGDDREFRETFNSALLLTFLVACASALVFAVIWLCVPLFRMSDEFHGAARWVVFAKACETFATIAFAPAINMFKVTERMVSHNVQQTIGRVSYFTAALVLFVFLGMRDPISGLIVFSIVSAGTVIIGKLCSSIIIWRLEPKIVFDPGAIRAATVKSVATIGGWNGVVVLAMHLHFPIDAIIMNAAFGLAGNFVWGLATQMTSYVRMLTMGMTDGVDAVATRISSGRERAEEALQSLTHHTTRLHGFVSFPTGLVLFLLAEPLLLLWIGDRIEGDDRAEAIAQIVALIRILSIGLVIRSITDNWTRILYGAGHIRQYALFVLAGGVANPVLALLLILIIPEPWTFTAAAWAYTIAMVVFHMLILTTVAARLMGTSFWHMLSGLLRPLLITAVCSPILIAPMLMIEWWSPFELIIVGAAFGATYTALSIRFAMTRDERRRFSRAALRRIGIGQPAVGGGR